MNKVAYNACYGGFSLSQEALALLYKAGVEQVKQDVNFTDPSNEHYYLDNGVSRHDPRLIDVIEKLGSTASGMCAFLSIKEIDGFIYKIDEYDGMETVVVPDSVEWIVIQ